MPTSPATHDSAPLPAAAPPSAPLLMPTELNPAAWTRAAARLLAKMIGEFAYEEILEPRPRGSGTYTLRLDDDFRLPKAANWRSPPSLTTFHPILPGVVVWLWRLFRILFTRVRGILFHSDTEHATTTAFPLSWGYTPISAGKLSGKGRGKQNAAAKNS